MIGRILCLFRFHKWIRYNITYREVMDYYGSRLCKRCLLNQKMEMGDLRGFYWVKCEVDQQHQVIREIKLSKILK